MNERVSEIIKDLSEALLAIISSICLIITTYRKRSKKSRKRKGKRWGQPHLPYTNNINYIHLSSQMKLIDYIVLVLLAFVLIEGFTGEFSNPTTFDWFKWISVIIMVFVYYIYKKRGHKNV